MARASRSAVKGTKGQARIASGMFGFAVFPFCCTCGAHISGFGLVEFADCVFRGRV